MRRIWIAAVLALVALDAAAQSIPRAADAFRRDLVRISRSVWGMAAPVAMLAAQIHAESAWRVDAVSRAGAQGLAQFMPATARDVAAQLGLPAAPFDPRWAMLAQSRYMRDIFGRMDARNTCERFAFTLSAYNGGEGRVRQRKRLSDDPLRCLSATCDINPGIAEHNQRENREYPRRILLRLEPVYSAAGWGPLQCPNYAEVR